REFTDLTRPSSIEGVVRVPFPERRTDRPPDVRGTAVEDPLGSTVRPPSGRADRPGGRLARARPSGGARGRRPDPVGARCPRPARARGDTVRDRTPPLSRALPVVGG